MFLIYVCYLGDNSKENITNALYREKTVEVVEIGQILLLRAPICRAITLILLFHLYDLELTRELFVIFSNFFPKI